MNMAQHTGTDLQAALRDAQSLIADRAAPAWLSGLRGRESAAAATMQLPTRRDEDWRYTPLAFLDEINFRPVVEGPFAALQLSDIEDLLLHDSGASRMVFVNGYLVEGLCNLGKRSDGVLVASLAGALGPIPDAIGRHLGGIADRRHLFAALNGALMSDGAVIHVPAGAAAQGAIEILHISVGLDEPGISHPRHLIAVEAGAEAQIIERYCSLGEAQYFTNALIEVVVGDAASLVHERLQEESREAQHLSDLHVRLGTGSHYRLNQMSMGAAWSRCAARVVFAGEGAQADINGLMLAADRQFNDVHLDVQHNVPGCTSRETFKGVLEGKGRIVFDGHILVAKDAQQSDAVLANDNLMLSRAAEVDTKPQLEIYADDVKCSHGTTVGELDPAMLFYLRSRGISAVQARQMLAQGFAQTIIDELRSESLRARTTAMLMSRLMGVA